VVDVANQLVELALEVGRDDEGGDRVDGPVARCHVRHPCLHPGESDVSPGVLEDGDVVALPGLQLVPGAEAGSVPGAWDHVTRQHLFEEGHILLELVHQLGVDLDEGLVEGGQESHRVGVVKLPEEICVIDQFEEHAMLGTTPLNFTNHRTVPAVH